MNFLAIIPARYATTRFPVKPLARLGGKPGIQRVYEQVAGVLDDAVGPPTTSASATPCGPSGDGAK